MAEISLFNKYHGEENTITNYCGLMLKILYQSSPANFEKCITGLIDSEKSISVEPMFEQQVNTSISKDKKNSIADLRIRQTEFELIFEVKTTDWFYEEQFNKYISSSEDSGIKSNIIFFALSNEFPDNSKFDEIKKTAEEKGIIIQELTFEKLLEELNKNKVNDEYYLRFLDEFEKFLENENLLPTWQSLLDVVNCTSSIGLIEESNIYTCPDTSGAYSHNRAKYFAPYNNKKVDSIYEIDCVAVVKYENGKEKIDSIRYNNSGVEESEIERRILEYFSKYESAKNELKKSDYKLQVFLLSNMASTSFTKESRGGAFWK